MTLYYVQLRERGGQPWSTPRVVRADTPEQAVREAFAEPPSSLNVHDAFVAALAEPFTPTSVLIDVPKPKWGKARPANPQAREPQRAVEVEYPLSNGVLLSDGRPPVEDVDPSLYDDREADARVDQARERAL